MGLMNRFRKGVATLNSATADVQTTVYRRRFVSENNKGVVSLTDPEPIQAIIEPKDKKYYDGAGRLIELQCQLTILTPLENPIDPRDVFIVGGQQIPQIVVDGAITDTGTLKNLLNMVTLGHIRAKTR